MMNLIFNLNIENTLVSKCDDIEYDGVLIPTLKITNKELFDSLLVEYVEKAISFYDEKEFSFLEDIKYLYSDQDIEQLKEEYLIKYIICTLLANLSYSDFEYPLGFLEDRIEMFDNPILENKELDFDLETINAKLHLVEEKSPIKTETPYRLTGYVEYDDGMTQEELITIVEEAQKDGDLEEHESDLITAAIEFNDLEVNEILTPRVDVVALDIETTMDEMEEAFRTNSYSRFPIYEDTIDNVIGILHEKDFYYAYYNDAENVKGILTLKKGEIFKEKLIPNGYEFGVAILVGYAVNDEGIPHEADLSKIKYVK